MNVADSEGGTPRATAPGQVRHDDATSAAPTRTDQILRLPILCDAAPEALRQVAGIAVWYSYEPGAMILNIDDLSSDVWFVLEGAVRIQVRTPAGRELILADVGPGEMFGEIAAIDGARRTAAATAVVRSRLCRVPGSAFVQAACSTPAASLALLRSVTTILRRQAKRILEREAMPIRLRLCSELLRLSRVRQSVVTTAGEPERIVSPPPRQHVLAARIGARREAVSRELAELARHGLIVRERGGIVIRRPDVLRLALEDEAAAETAL